MKLKPLSRCGKCPPGPNGCTSLRPCVVCAEMFAPRSHDPFFLRVCLPCLERAIEEVTP